MEREQLKTLSRRSVNGQAATPPSAAPRNGEPALRVPPPGVPSGALEQNLDELEVVKTRQLLRILVCYQERRRHLVQLLANDALTSVLGEELRQHALREYRRVLVG